MEYGVGVDALSGALRGDGVIRTEPQEVTGASGQTTQFHMEKVETTEDLQQALHVSADVDVSYGFAGGSARFDFAETCAMHGYSIYLLVRAEVGNSFRQMRDVQLKPQASDLLKNGQADRFREQYGDVYVRGMATGGAFYAVLELTTKSESEQRQISADLEVSAGGIGASFDASASFSQSVSKATERKSVRVRSFQEGGQDTRQPTTAADMVAKAVAFAAQVAGSEGVPYEVLLLDYRTLDLPAVPNWVDLQNAKEVLQDLWILRNQLRSNLNNIDYILTHQDQFENPNVAALNTSASGFKTAIRDVTRAASQCIDKPLEAQFPNIAVPQVTLPARKGGTTRPTIVLNRDALRALASMRLEQQQKQPRADLSHLMFARPIHPTR
jgi:hypothetical protein